MLNSLYGVLGLPSFRFYDIDNAEATTITGQTVIKTTELIANQYYSKVIGKEADYNVYTDTDSVFYQAAPLVKARNPELNEESDEEMIPAILSAAKEVEQLILTECTMLWQKSYLTLIHIDLISNKKQSQRVDFGYQRNDTLNGLLTTILLIVINWM